MIGDIGEGHHEFDGAFKEKLVAPRRRRPQKGDDDDAEDGSGAGVSSDPPVAKKNGGWSEISAEGAATVGGESSKRRGARCALNAPAPSFQRQIAHSPRSPAAGLATQPQPSLPFSLNQPAPVYRASHPSRAQPSNLSHTP